MPTNKSSTKSKDDNSQKEVKAFESELNPFKFQSYLAGMDYPASKDDIVDKASNSEASGAVMDILKQIPERDYNTPAELMKEVGKFLKQ